LYVTDPAWVVPLPALHEHRLPSGGPVSVSNEEQFQETLKAVVAGRPLDVTSVPTITELRWGTNPFKKTTDPVIEVLIGGNPVGYLTPSMSARFGPLLANASGQTVTCEASVFAGHKGGDDIIEVRLHAQHP
jgi:hypothetical protein